MKAMSFEDLCQGNSIRGVKISPDGKLISFIKKDVDGEQLVFFSCDSLNRKKFICKRKFTNIVGYLWSYSTKYILLISDPLNNGMWNIHRYNVYENKIDKEINIDNCQVKIYGIDKKVDSAVLGINRRNPQFFDIYRLDIENWKMELVYKNDSYFRLIFDSKHRVRLGCKMNTDGSYYIDNIEKKVTMTKIDTNDFFGTFPLCITSDNQLLLRDSRNRDKSVISKMNLDNCKTNILAFSNRVDVDESFIDPVSGDIAAVAFYYKRKFWKCFNNETESVFKLLQSFNAGDMSIVSTSSDGNRWIVEYSNSDYPLQYVLFEKKEEKITLLLNEHRDENKDLYVKKQAIVTENSYEDKILCYLMEPKTYQNKGLIVFLHGGPWQRDTCKFIYLHQWLVSKGFYVLTINYRGSQGFGKTFLNAAARDCVKVLNEDIVASTSNIIKEKRLDIKNIAIMGNSFGGYLAQLGITERPDFFTCGISIGGVSNLGEGLKSYPVYKGFQKDIFKIYISSDDSEKVCEQSPVFKINCNTSSLLLIHGINDPIVNYRESVEMIQKMMTKDVNVLGVLFSGEGHSVKKIENKICLYTILDKFLSYFLLQSYHSRKMEIKNENIIIYGNLKDILFIR
ncbi:alpha/beta hydrolase family protein [Blautia sp. DFI.1.216]|uniref:alpha/beta hydrolase family protein n=1 Tax=Blautia sp. DFI.1.216 TaxID=2885264 RepID=UPI001D0B8E14|nr:prolyl oligopeptidase family serine peptidase [Blautia sp. DFI.1.216]MCB8723935.1 prolyl oligopeptidase family serine peptidase [Blautia sp. DFI.1.216]